jgi:hypothetical protein
MRYAYPKVWHTGLASLRGQTRKKCSAHTLQVTLNGRENVLH